MSAPKTRTTSSAVVMPCNTLSAATRRKIFGIAHPVRRGAGRTDFSHQARGNNAAERVGHNRTRNPHLDETNYQASDVESMKSRKNQQAGQRRLKSHLRRVRIADLADHDDIGILPQN